MDEVQQRRLFTCESRPDATLRRMDQEHLHRVFVGSSEGEVFYRVPS